MRVFCVALVLGGLTACDSSEPESAAATATTQPGASQVAVASADSAAVEARRTEHYELRVAQPTIDPSHLPLLRAVSVYSGQTRDEFVGQVEAAKAEGFQFESPWSLELEMRTVIDSPQLVVVEASGYQFQGGAHGVPLQASFVYLVESSQVMGIADWFADEAVWAVISSESIATLKTELAPLEGEDDDASEEALDAEAGQWLADGAGPDPHNFHLYRPLVGVQGEISGFQISFAPYQVAPYAAGSPTVEISADSLKPFLKSEFVEFFQ